MPVSRFWETAPRGFREKARLDFLRLLGTPPSPPPPPQEPLGSRFRTELADPAVLQAMARPTFAPLRPQQPLAFQGGPPRLAGDIGQVAGVPRPESPGFALPAPVEAAVGRVAGGLQEAFQAGQARQRVEGEEVRAAKEEGGFLGGLKASVMQEIRGTLEIMEPAW